MHITPALQHLASKFTAASFSLLIQRSVKSFYKGQSPDQALCVAWFLFIPSQLFEMFNRSNRIGNNFNQGLSTAINSLHRWLALKKLPPRQPPREHIPIHAEKEANSLFIFICGKFLFRLVPYRKHLTLLGLYFREDIERFVCSCIFFSKIQIYIYFFESMNGVKKTSQTSPT